MTVPDNPGYREFRYRDRFGTVKQWRFRTNDAYFVDALMAEWAYEHKRADELALAVRLVLDDLEQFREDDD